MDVNGTRLHLVLGPDDWRRAIVAPVDPDVCYDTGRNTLGLRPRPFVFPTRGDARALVPSDRRGADVDGFGNRFWIGPDHRTIRVLGAGQAAASTYWPGDEPSATVGPGRFGICAPPIVRPLHLAGLAVTDDQHLVVGVLDLAGPAGTGPDETAGLLVFDLAGGGPPVAMGWPAGLGVRPVDLAAVPGGGVVVLDVAEPDAPGIARLWQLDAHLRLVELEPAPPTMPPVRPFAPVDAAPAEPTMADVPPRAVELSRATERCAAPLDATWAVAVDALPDGSVVVLDRLGPDGRLEVSRWRCGQRVPFRLRLDDVEGAATEFVCSDQRSNAHEILADARGHDLVVVAGRLGPDGEPTASLYVVDDRGDQAFEFRLDGSGADLVATYHPLRLFGGKGLISDGERPQYDLEQRWFPVPSRTVERFAAHATVVLAPAQTGGRGFDAGAPGTVWHRLLLDATIPPGTSVEVETRTADDPVVLAARPWQPEPAPYHRSDGSEIPYHRYPDGEPCAGQGTWELLFQRAVGRHLQLRLTLRGDGRRSPRIWAMRIHFPRFSYLEHYLPDVFRADRDSASFLDRYLANVEGMYTTLEGRIVEVQRLVDPGATDPAYLPWLASWVGAVVEPDWEPDRVRLFVRHAARLFARRGTTRGLVEAIRLATHPCPTEDIFDPQAGQGAFDVRIVEAFRTRSVPGVVFGDPSDLAGPRLGDLGPRWQLADGRARLEARWIEFLGSRHPPGAGRSLTSAVAAGWSTSESDIGTPPRFPALTPAGTAARRDWTDFVASGLAVTYAEVTDADVVAFRSFLEQRYRRIEDHHAAWNLQGTSRPPSFGAVALPTRLPADGTPLQDWITFVSSILPIRRSAHRCSVLVPIRFDDSDELRAQRLGKVQRVVEVDRPAHTVVDVQPYWAALRVGEARVGLETIVGEGSRYVDLVLGAGRLSHALVPGGGAWRRPDRLVVGRDRIERPVPGPAGTGGS